jgi:hypothetical protein
MRTALVAMVALGLLGQAGCPGKQPDRKQLYFKPLLPPVGIAVDVVRDVSFDTPEGGTLQVLSVIQPNLDRDELNQLMRSFFRQAKSRRRFRGGASAKQIDLRFYDSEAGAKQGGQDWLGQAAYTPTSTEPVFTNHQKPPLLKWAKRAFGPQPQYAGEIKPRILVDTESMAVEVTLPFVKYDGSGQPVDRVSFQRATTAFSSTTRNMFDKISELEAFTVVGTHHGETVIRVRLTRHQYRQLNLNQVEESLGELRGRLMEMYLARRIGEKAMARRLSVRRHRLYRDVFALLPPKDVIIAPGLR